MSNNFIAGKEKARMISNDPITQRLQLTKIAIDIALDTHQMSQSLENWLTTESESIEIVLEKCGV